MNTPTDCFSTFDLNLTACMVALGHPLEKIQKTEGNRSQFLFQRSQGLETDITAYWKQDLLLNPHTIFDSLKIYQKPPLQRRYQITHAVPASHC